MNGDLRPVNGKLVDSLNNVEKNMRSAQSKTGKIPGRLGLLALAVLAGQQAVAQEDEGWYLSAGIGGAKATIDEERIIEGLQSEGFATTGFDDDDGDTAYKIFGGYRFNSNLSLEAGYFDLGRYDFTATLLPPATLRGDIGIEGLNVDAVGILPLGERFSALARIGIVYAEADTRFSSTGAALLPATRFSESDTNIKYGLGLRYEFTDALGLQLDAERYRIDDAVGSTGDIDLLSLSLVYRFGAGSALVAESTPEPAPAPVAVVRAPPPAPAPAPVPATPPPPIRVTLSADSLFDFDSSTIRPAGLRELDVLADDLMGVDYEVITVTGHTDRLGAQDYNQALSLRRAVAVKDYLVTKGLPAAKITARGLGGTRSVLTDGQCDGAVRTPELVVCLQPERRVEVEVAGTR